MDIIFQAARFDEAGNKTAHAKFVKVVHNGLVIQETRDRLNSINETIEKIDKQRPQVYIEAKFENRQIAAAEAEGFSDPLGPVPYLYLVLLKQVYDRLPEGAWVIAHDNLDWSAKKQMAPYLEFVRDGAHFSESICFDIDDCGMELSIR